jgi:hypothetical protein
VAVPGEVPAFVIVVFIELPEPAAPPLTPLCVGATQLQLLVPPVVLLDNVIPAPVPEHIVGLDGKAEATGIGLTVIVCIRLVVPRHVTLLLVYVGVIVYTAVPGVVPVTLKAPVASDEPEPELPLPVTPV